MNSNFTRRRFLKTVVVSAGAVGAGGLIGCGSSSSSQHGDENSSNLGSTDVNAITDESLFVVNKATNANTFPQSVASGDPRHNSIILWSRIESGSSADLGAALQVSTSKTVFDDTTIVARAQIVAEASHDHCMRVKVNNLESGVTYYYRFIYDGTPTKVGRFKTAPSLTSTGDVKFGFASCQDFVGRYYNTYLKFLEPDHIDTIDFIVHLGDYIYETDGDPGFQASAPADRQVNFTDEASSITLTTSDGEEFHAASALSNYRDLYKTYRSDEILQQLHENFAFICIWDDHEFSDDSWQENGTYLDGTVSEASVARKKNAEQAFFEYQPLDIDPSNGLREEAGQINIEQDDLFPSSIYRNFRFGKTMSLTMSDFRTYRPDHAIPEDAFPGKVEMTQLNVAQTLYLVDGTFKAGVDATLAGVSGGTLTAVANIRAPSATEIAVLEQVVLSLVASNTLPLLAYTDIDDVQNTDLLTFLATLNGVLGGVGQAFSANANPSLKELIIVLAKSQYMSAGLNDGAAQTKADEVVTGNLAIAVINTFLLGYYSVLAGLGVDVTLLGATRTIPDAISDTTGAFDGATFDPGTGAVTLTGEASQLDTLANNWGTVRYGVPFALLGKQSVMGNNGIGSRYFVVKSTYELLAGYRTLVLGDTAHDDAWGTAQTTLNTISLAGSFADKTTWNVLGSSVAFTSLVLDAQDGTGLNALLDGAGISDAAFPRTEYFFNVDHWDGFPNRRLVLMENINDPSKTTPTDILPISLKDANTIILSGDIHAAYATDHGPAGVVDPGTGQVTSGNLSNTFGALGTLGRAIEFTVPGVSSGSFARFVGDAGYGILASAGDDADASRDKQITAYGLAKNLDGFLTSVTSATVPTWADSNKSGVAIIEATSTKLTTTYHMLEDLVNIDNFNPLDPATFFTSGFATPNADFATTGLSSFNSQAFTKQYDGVGLTWTTRVFEVANNVGVQTGGFNLNGPLEDVTPT